MAANMDFRGRKYISSLYRRIRSLVGWREESPRPLPDYTFHIPDEKTARCMLSQGINPLVKLAPYELTGIKVHVGAGQNILPGYENIDGFPDIHRAECFPTAAKKFARAEVLDAIYEPDTLAEIRLHHVFEHISLLDLDRTLRTWNKLLKHGGVVHIEVPDFEACVRRIIEAENQDQCELFYRHIFGSQVSPGEFHFNGLTPSRLITTLERYGFKVVLAYTQWVPRTPHPLHLNYPHNAPLPDLTVKAIKVGKPSKETQADWTHLNYRRVHPNPDLMFAKVPDVGGPSDAAKLVGFNSANRHAWVSRIAESLPAGARVLDVGAGECQYAPLFSHCKYKSQDFAQYHGTVNGLLKENWQYGRIDYVCDAAEIPVPDGSFDAVLCTEVLEHVPEPIRVLKEIARVLAPGGKAYITAPLGSGLHQQPHHYYGGYTPHWYRKFAPEVGLRVESIEPNGRFFRFLSQEIARGVDILEKQSPELAQHPLTRYLREGVNYPLINWLVHFDDQLPIEEFTVGYHVQLVKQG